MRVLDYFFSIKLENIDTFPRKLQLPTNSNFLLYGARGVGKTYLIVDYLKKIKRKYLYIDCEDPIFILEDLNKEELENFIKEEDIKILILDHFFEGFLEELPNINQLIIVSRKELTLNMPTFKLFALDFEEFLSFNKTYNIESAFNKYTKKGSLPAIAKAEIFNFKEFFFEKFEEQEGKVMLILALFQAKITTPHQIYQKAKEYFKISKDWLYKALKKFEEEGIIYLIKGANKGFGKKLIIYDFAFSAYLNKYQTFLTTFDTTIALALIKHNFKFIFLSTPLGYIINNTFIQISPFDNEDSAWVKAYKAYDIYNKFNIKEVILVTISTHYEFIIKDISFKAVPFYEWAVGLS